MNNNDGKSSSDSKGSSRAAITIGSKVMVVQKQDQQSGQLTEGVV
ncbi:MAG: DUF2196 domain-containing protein, partial [Vallitaleaceae bacterium]|nr:DUF2196 domain-containing protein [Vallitaleaceae bacterium]